MEIRRVNDLSNDQSSHLFQWRGRVFPVEGKEITWAKSTSHLLAFDQGSMPIAHLGYGGFPVYLPSRGIIQVVGVGGVVVRPEAQGKRIPSQLFNYLHGCSHALEISKTFALFCPRRLIGYYQKHGYMVFEGALTFLQNGAPAVAKNFAFMFYGDPLSADKIEVQSEPW